MALTFHDGFEASSALVWDSLGGSPSFSYTPVLIQELDQNYTGSSVVVDIDNLTAQTFTPTSDFCVGSVSVYMKKLYDPSGDLEIAIQGVDGSNHPDGSDIYSETFSQADISTSFAWHTFYFSKGRVRVSNGTRYAIVLRSPTSGSGTGYQGYADNISGDIPNGNLEHSDNGGSSWTALTAYDLTIKIVERREYTGNYCMTCDSSGSSDYVVKDSGTDRQRATFYLLIAETPSSGCRIFGIADTDQWSLYLDSSRYIDLYYGATPTKKADGTNQLSIGVWYRISISADGSGNVKVYIDGIEEHSQTQSGVDHIESNLGVLTSDTAELYFDDYACDGTTSTDDIGDIRTLAARPTANGTDQDFGSGKWQQRIGGSDTGNNPSYANLAEIPPNTDQGAWEEANSTAHYFSVDLDNCGSGNLADIGSSDTIHAVNFIFYYETDGGGTAAYYMYGRDTSGRSSTVELDDPKAPTWITQYQTISWDDDASAWSQSEFDDQEIGMMCQDSIKDMWWYEAYAMVAFEPAAGPIALTGTCDATSTVSGDIEVEKEITGACDAQSTVDGDLNIYVPLTGTIDAQSGADADLSVKIKITGTCDATSIASGDIEVAKEVTGAIDATSVVSGDIEVEKLLTGIIDAASTVDADLSVEKLILGTCDAQSAVSGDISVKIKLTGTCDATSTVDADLSVTKEFTGTIDAAATVDADLSVIKEFTGTCDAQSTIDADLSVTKEFTGTCDAQSTVEGDLTIQSGTIPLTGTCDAQSTVDGDLNIYISLTGTIDAQSSVLGDIEVEKEITGTCDAQSTITGSLSVKKEITGACDAQSTITGSLSVKKEITGTIDAQTTVDGDLSVGVLPIDGTCDATSTVSGDIEVEKEITGTIDAQSNVSGQLSVKKLITGSCAAQSAVAADITTFAFLSGSIISQSAISSPGLDVLKNLTGIIQAAGSVDGNILVLKQLTGIVSGVSTLTGVLTGAGVTEAEIDLPDDWMWIAEMINEDGRAMWITVPGDPIDPAEPWRGNTPGTPVSAKGIFVGHEANKLSGDHVRRQEQRLLVAPASNIEIHKGTKIVDTIDGSDWYVESFKKITEETDILLYILKVKQ